MCGGKFHFCCGRAFSYILVTTAFSCYGFHFIYMHVQVRFMQTAEGYSFSRIMYVALTVAGAGYMSASGRSCDRPSRHRFCLVSLCLSISECWDGSLYSKLLLQFSMDGNYRRCYAVGCTTRHREGRGKRSRFPRNPVWYIHRSIEQMCFATYQHAIQTIFVAKDS